VLVKNHPPKANWDDHLHHGYSVFACVTVIVCRFFLFFVGRPLRTKTKLKKKTLLTSQTQQGLSPPQSIIIIIMDA
jgi:hypothetical protein